MQQTINYDQAKIVSLIQALLRVSQKQQQNIIGAVFRLQFSNFIQNLMTLKTFQKGYTLVHGYTIIVHWILSF